MSQFQPPSQPDYTSPQTYHPRIPVAMPGMQQPRPPVPKRRSGLFRIVAACLLILVAIFSYAIGYASGKSSASSSQSTAQQTPATDQSTQAVTSAPTHPPATPVPTHTPKWTTVQTFNGNGNKKTAIFTAPDDWKINWTCYGFNDGSGVDGVMSVTVYGADGSIIDAGAVNATCKAGSKPTSDFTEEHQGGQVYLDIGATGQWSIQIQELK